MVFAGIFDAVGQHSHTSAISYHEQLKAFNIGPSLLLHLFLAILGWDQGKLRGEVAQAKTSTTPARPTTYTASSCLSLLSQLGPSHHHKARSTPGSNGIHQPQSTQRSIPSRLPWGLNLANQKHSYHWREETEKALLTHGPNHAPDCTKNCSGTSQAKKPRPCSEVPGGNTLGTFPEPDIISSDTWYTTPW